MKTITFDENTHKLVPLSLDPAKLQRYREVENHTNGVAEDDNGEFVRLDDVQSMLALAPPAAPVAAVPEGSLSEAILHALYKNAQRGFSCERIHATIMALIAQHSTPPSDGATSPELSMSMFGSLEELKAEEASRAQAVGVDTPELRELVDCYVRFFSTDEPGEKGEEYWRAIIAHITALVQAAKQEGRLEGLEQAAKVCAAMERTSPRKPYQEAAAWLATRIALRARITELEVALTTSENRYAVLFTADGDDTAIAAQSVKVEPLAELPNDEWEAYARRSELLNESGVAPNPFQAQTAYNAYRAAWNRSYEFNRAALAAVQPVVPQAVKLEDIEQYRMQMAGISTAAFGYWKEGESIHPDYDTPALRDVAKLYAKYEALFKAAELTRPTVPDAAAVRDTKRLDFIERNSVCKYNSAGINWQLGQYDMPGRYLTLREAIDRALAASPAATKEPQ